MVKTLNYLQDPPTETAPIDESVYYTVDRNIMPKECVVEMDNITSQYSGFEERYNNSYAADFVTDKR